MRYKTNDSVTLNGTQMNTILDMFKHKPRYSEYLKLMFNEQLFLKKIVTLQKDLKDTARVAHTYTTSRQKDRDTMAELTAENINLRKQLQQLREVNYTSGQMK